MASSFKKVLELFKLDWKRIFKNKLTFLLIIALMIIPSLYAWFNIAALWDPYSNTKDIAIAVYSEDKTAVVMDKKINIGDKIVKNLKDNKTIGWQFVDSKKELDEGVESGKYYAGIYLPRSFSENLVSFVDGDIKKPEIQYSVNQKINAIAPKIADKGAGTIKDTISNQFIETVSGTLLKTFNEIGYDLDSNSASINKITSKVLKLDDNLEKIDGYTKEVLVLNDKMPDYKTKLAKANEFIDYLPEVNKVGDKLIEVNKMMPEIKKSGKMLVGLQSKIPEIENAGRQVAIIDNDFDDIVTMMNDAIKEANKGVAIINQAQQVLPEVQKLAVTANEVIPQVSESIGQVEQALPQIATGVGSGLQIITVIASDISDISGELATVVGNHELTPEKKAEIKEALSRLNSQLAGLNQMISSTVGMLQRLQEITGGQELQSFINRLTDAQKLIPVVQDKINRVIIGIDDFSSTELQQALLSVSQQAGSLSAKLGSINVSEIQEKVTKMLGQIQQMLAEAKNITGVVIDKELILQLDSLLTNTTATINQAVGFLEKYQKELPAVKKELHSANELLNGNMSTIVSAINKASGVYTNDLPVIEDKLGKASVFVQKDLPKIEKELQGTLETVNKKLPQVEEALDSASQMIATDWPNIRQGIHRGADLIRKGQEDFDLKEIVKILKTDAKSESDFIASPVKLIQKDVYPVPNYGSASAPFYTALCLWVGAVLFSSIATTDFHLSKEDQKKYTKRQQFLARMGTFLVVGFFQSLIVSVGNLFLLGTYSVSPVLSVLFSLLVGFTFMMMVYVLVALFGNLGKGAAVIILVLSISAGGGNFPIEMSGKFFRMINPLLPFTHAVNLLREPVGGVYWPNTIKAIIILVVIAIGFLVFGLTIYPRSKKLFGKLNKSLQEGHILH